MHIVIVINTIRGTLFYPHDDTSHQSIVLCITSLSCDFSNITCFTMNTRFAIDCSVKFHRSRLATTTAESHEHGCDETRWYAYLSINVEYMTRLLWRGYQLCSGQQIKWLSRDSKNKHTYLVQGLRWSSRPCPQDEALPLHIGWADACDRH
jgi:hypothetical protein